MEKQQEKTPREIMEHPYYQEQRARVMKEVNSVDPSWFPNREVFKMNPLQKEELFNKKAEWRRQIQKAGGTKHKAPYSWKAKIY